MSTSDNGDDDEVDDTSISREISSSSLSSASSRHLSRKKNRHRMEGKRRHSKERSRSRSHSRSSSHHQRSHGDRDHDSVKSSEGRINKHQSKEAFSNGDNDHDQKSSSSRYRERDKKHKSKRTKRKHHSSKKETKKSKKRSVGSDESTNIQTTLEGVDLVASSKYNESANSKGAELAMDQVARDAMEKEASNDPVNDQVDARRARMAPMSRDEYEKQQSVIREVYDSESGRWRLVRGSGEIIERIVSRDDHQRINQRATRGDGSNFSKQIYDAVHRR